MAHIIDKPFEALSGFIHVLPGAYSGFRYEALKKKNVINLLYKEEERKEITGEPGFM